MRRWIAALALVPAVAWGQGSDCYSVKAHDLFAEMLDMVERGHQGGMSDRQLLDIYHDSATPVRAAWIEAVGHVSRDSGMSMSAIISAMQSACAREDYANRP